MSHKKLYNFDENTINILGEFDNKFNRDDDVLIEKKFEKKKEIKKDLNKE
jgi:hypothetical protein